LRYKILLKEFNLPLNSKKVIFPGENLGQEACFPTSFLVDIDEMKEQRKAENFIMRFMFRANYVLTFIRIGAQLVVEIFLHRINPSA
jgi:hypothetical protein